MFVVVEIFISEIVDEHGKHPVSAEWDDAWYHYKHVNS
jgi:hypothetical protein